MTEQLTLDLPADRAPMVTLINDGCLEAMRRMADNSVDAIVTDPPYGLSNTTPAQVAETLTKWVTGDREYLPTAKGFMGAEWDAFVPPVAVWDEALRVLKPGGHLLAFAGTRTMDLMTLGIRLAGFDIRDSIAWLYGSGFPKSMDVSKAIDKAAGAEREVIGSKMGQPGYTLSGGTAGSGILGSGITSKSEAQRLAETSVTAAATDAARQWEGWGTALKPAFEPVVVARKPIVGTVAQNVLTHGTGALNIDACRIGVTAEDAASRASRNGKTEKSAKGTVFGNGWGESRPGIVAGRFPANVMLDESQAEALDQQSGMLKTHGGGDRRSNSRTVYGAGGVDGGEPRVNGPDSGGASRFFYVAKAGKRERPVVDGVAHSTVKPLALMRQLVRLVTPPGGVVLEPFAGSGTTLEACVLEGFDVIGVERDPRYLPLIQERLRRNG